MDEDPRWDHVGHLFDRAKELRKMARSSVNRGRAKTDLRRRMRARADELDREAITLREAITGEPE